MNCRKVSNLLSAYMDGELTGVDHLSIRDHLKCCTSCSDEYESLLFTKRVLSGLRVKEPSDCLEERIRRCVAMQGSRPAPVSSLENWRMRAEGWWSVLAYPQKLRYTAVFAASSIAVAVITITPNLAPKSDPLGIQPGTTIAGNASQSGRTVFAPASSGRALPNILPTYHDPAENPPPSGGAPVLVPVSIDEPTNRGR